MRFSRMRYITKVSNLNEQKKRRRRIDKKEDRRDRTTGVRAGKVTEVRNDTYWPPDRLTGAVSLMRSSLSELSA